VSFYRLYFRDDGDHFSGCTQFDAPDEARAIERADRMYRGLDRELWWESRLLKRWISRGAGGVPSNDLAQAQALPGHRRARLRSQRRSSLAR